MEEIATDEDSAEWHSGKARQKERAGRGRASGGPVRRKAAARHEPASGKPPAFEKPQLATLVGEAPEGDDWLHEVKFDGYRVLVAVGGGTARCFTRSGLDWTEKFSGIAEAMESLDCRECADRRRSGRRREGRRPARPSRHCRRR